MRCLVRCSVFILIISSVFFQQVSAELILTAPPRESRDQGIELYGPLADHLTKLLGNKVIYRHPRDWLRYQRDIRRDEFDIVFDGPHFVSWRILHRSHTVLAKLPGKLDFYFITHANSEINKPKDLVLRKVCSIPPPNLTSLVLLNVLNSPIREPIIESVTGGMPAVIRKLSSRECDAGVVRKSFFDKKLSKEKRSQFKVIYSSHAIPNQAITASQRVKSVDIDKIIKSITEGDGVDVTNNIIKRFAGSKVSSFVAADKKDFEGQNQLLEGVVLGW